MSGGMIREPRIRLVTFCSVLMASWCGRPDPGWLTAGLQIAPGSRVAVLPLLSGGARRHLQGILRLLFATFTFNIIQHLFDFFMFMCDFWQHY